jgi:hypothetical protein
MNTTLHYFNKQSFKTEDTHAALRIIVTHFNMI